MSPSLSLKIANKNAAADSAEVRSAAAFDPRLGMSRGSGGCGTCANVPGEREHMCVCARVMPDVPSHLPISVA